MNVKCACCDEQYDKSDVTPIKNIPICYECEDACPHDPTGQNHAGPFQCFISGKPMKSNVETALNNHHYPTAAPGAPIPPPGRIQPGQMQQLLNAMVPSGPLPFAPPIPPKPIPPDAKCDNHGGPWGDDETCEKCTDENGNPKPYKKPKPPPKHLTASQSVALDSDLERMKLQLKAGLNEDGRPLKDAERKQLERQVEIHSQELTDDEEVRALLGMDDSDAEIRRLLGIDPS